MEKSYFKPLLLVCLMLTVFMFSACQKDEQPESRDLTVTIDGEVLEMEPNTIAPMWLNSQKENSRLELFGTFYVEGEKRYLNLTIETLDNNQFEEGTVPNEMLWSLDYSIDIGNSWENWFDEYQTFTNPDPHFTFEDIEVSFDKLSNNRIIGEVSLTFPYEDETTVHVINFDYSDPEGNLIGNSYTTGGGDGDGDGDGNGNGDSDGSSGDCSIDDYNGPEFDIQVDAQCKAAYLYDCLGDEDARDAACALYYQYGEEVWTGSGPLPECPYCP